MEGKRVPVSFLKDWAATPKLDEPQEPADGVVYFIALGGLVKIGKTRNLKSRVNDFSHPDIRVLASQPGYTELEAELHRRFKAFRIKGEWFHPAPVLLEYVASLQK